MKLRILGGVEEVGRLAIAVKCRQSLLLMDYGVLLGEEPGFPAHITPREVDAIAITHAHLDHSGAAPLFYVSKRIPIYATPPTFDLMRLLITDFLRLSSYYLPYEYLDLEVMLRSSVSVPFNKWRQIANVQFKFLNAGHIPGSAQVLVRCEDKKLLFTGDFNTQRTRLLHEAPIPDEEVDAVVIESTYAGEDHEDRGKLELSFIDKIREVIEGGGNVLVPAFSVGRAQEILCILAAWGFDYPVILDGMARSASKILIKYPRYLNDPKLLKKAMNSSTWIKGQRHRRRTLEEGGKVIVAPAGMLKGGAAVFYAENLLKEDKNAVFLVNYQIPGTPGYELLTKSTFIIEGEAKKVKAKVERFDFSSHCGKSELHDFVRSLKGNPIIFVVHGTEENSNLLTDFIREDVGLDAVIPGIGAVYKV